MKNVRLIRLLLFIAFVLLVFACSNDKKNKGVYYKPKAKEKIMTDDERENAIQAKRAELLSFDSLLYCENIKLSIFIPKTTDRITHNVSSYALSKMMKIVTQNGIGCIGGDPIFALAMTMTPLKGGITNAIPQQKYTNYDINIYVGNMVTGDLYGSYRKEIIGIGDTDEAAAINAISAITNSPEIQSMLKTSSKKIVAWYNENSRTYISMVESLVSLQDYSQALSLLKSVPQECEACFAYAESRMGEISKKLLEQLATRNLEALKHSIATCGSRYNPEAYAYLRMIPSGSPEKVEGQKIFDLYVENLIEEEREAVVHKRFMEKEQIAYQKLELQQQMEANQTMIEMYMRDSSVNQTNNDDSLGINALDLIGAFLGGGSFMGLIGETVQLGIGEMFKCFK